MRMLRKIYVSFWIALGVLMTAVMVNVFTALWSSVEHPSPRTIALDVLRDCADSAANKYERGGSQLLLNDLAQSGGSCPAAILVDTNRNASRDVLNTKLSSRDTDFVQQVKNSGKVTFELFPWRNSVAIPVVSERTSYIYIATIWAVSNSFPLRAALQLFTVALISGILCYLLTLYFGRPLTKLGQIVEMLGTGDLSARIDVSLTRRKDEIGDLAQCFNRMADRIETLIAEYKNFLAHVSHELGSPLTRVNMALGLARRKAPASMEPELDRIGDETERLSTLVQELLLLARLESGNELDRQTSSFNVGLVVEEACADVNFEAGLVGKSVVFRRRKDFAMNGHRELLRRSLDNVLHNGLRFSREAGSVQVDVFRHKDKPIGIIAIHDDGPGVLPAQEERIFEPFVSLPNRVTGLNEGSGLGLAISRQGVLANGGTIYARNSDQGGLTVTIELPVTDYAEPLLMAEDAESMTVVM